MATKKKPKTQKRYPTYEPDYAKARAAAEALGTIIKVRTKQVRIIAQPARVTSPKRGDRIFGAERLRPATVGWRLKRVFIII